MDDDRGSSEHKDPEEPIHLSAEKARGGEIILRSRTRRIIFIAGLAVFVLFILFLYMARS